MTPGDTTVEFVRRCRHCGEPLSATSGFCSKCGATAETPGGGTDQLRDKLTALFGAELEFERELGRGGMAVVYGAFDPALQRRVAVKVLLPEIANDRSMADRFMREARTVAALQHPHVVTVYTVRSAEGVHAIVMQFVEGRGLDAVLKERGKIPVHVAGMLLAQAASGLQHAHDRGVIHRDVKPSNVLIDSDGRAIVSDFGIARRESGPRTTDTGLVVGTWAYMSPEQRAADKIAPATDQYALGVMAFELLTGQLPFNGNAGEMMRGHMHEPPPSLRAIRPEVAPNVETLVHRMLAKKPEERWPSLKEPERVFRTLIPDEGKTTLQLAAYSKVIGGKSSVIVAATRPVPEVARAAPTERYSRDEPAAGGAEAAPAAPAVQQASSNRAGLLLVGAAVVVVGAIGAWAMFGRGPKPVFDDPPGNPVTNAAAPITQPTGAASAPSGAAGASSAGATGARGAATLPAGSPNGTQPGGAIAPAPLVSSAQKSAVTTPPTDVPAPRVEPKQEEKPAPVRPEPAAAAATTPASPPAAVPPAATVADARRLGREFVTLLNQHRYRELGQIPQVGGDAAARAELIKLTETAADFAAGFDRVASAPADWANGFETDFVLDLEWRGGKKQLRIRLFAAHNETGWHTAGFAAEP
jgi:serine/threonine-protein kinase